MFPHGRPRSPPGLRVRSVRDAPVSVAIQDGCAAAVGGEQCLDPGTEFGVTAALALQVGGPLRRVGKVRRVQEKGFRSCGIDGHGLPPGPGMILLPHRTGLTLNAPSRGKVSHGIRIIFSKPRGARPGRTSSFGRPSPGKAPAPRPPPRPKARRTGGAERPAPRPRLPPRAG